MSLIVQETHSTHCVYVFSHRSSIMGAWGGGGQMHAKNNVLHCVFSIIKSTLHLTSELAVARLPHRGHELDLSLFSPRVVISGASGGGVQPS